MGNRRRSSSNSKSKRHPKAKKDVKELMPEICDEIIYSILLHLPVRTLVRFRSLSKRYREIINSSSFVNEHMRSVSKSDAPLYFIFSAGWNDDDGWNFAYLQTYRISSIHNHKPRIEQLSSEIGEEFEECTHELSCNGLVCLFRIDQRQSDYKSRILVWNPATRQRKELNWPTFSLSFRDSLELRLHGFLGFGYDPSTDDYKIVIMVGLHNTDQWEGQVWSLKENNWRSLVMPTSLGYYSDMFFTSVDVNGDLYWIASKFDEPCWIMKFNLADESFRFPSMPPETYENRAEYKLVTLDGLLYLSSFYWVGYKCSNDIWMLKDHTTWVKKFSLQNFGRAYRLVGFNTNGDVIMTHYDDNRLTASCFIFPKKANL